MNITKSSISVLLKTLMYLLVGSLWKIMEKIVTAYSNSELDDEGKKKAAIEAFREQLLIVGKEFSDNTVNFLLEAAVLYLKLNK